MNHSLFNCPNTLNTTRICGTNAVNTAIEVSKIGFTNMKPNAVILVSKNEVFEAISATPLVHFPINAPILFTDGNRLSKETLDEITRLSPEGYNGVQVILVGSISWNVSQELNYYGFRTYHITGHNHYEIACKVSRERKEFKNILIISGEDFSEGIMATYWSAHHGDPILFVQRNNIPSCTLETIRKMNDINVYIIGSTKTVSKTIESTLSQLHNVKHLDRIDGVDPYDITVNFARYKDPKAQFGWDRDYRDGHAFTFSTLSHPMETIAAVLFAHMGKHTPLLLTRNDMLPSIVEEYIKSVKPLPPKDMPRPPFMHGFIIGDVTNINQFTQVMIEDILSIDYEMMGMEHEDQKKTFDTDNQRINEWFTYEHLNYGFKKVNIDDLIE
jgi:putative cell wall-binding protein